MQEFAKIVLFAVGAAVSYGVMHDQITARICVEYFTVGHPQVFATTSPTLLGLGWGVIATWWVGIALGVPLALAARLGREPKLSAAFFLRPLGRLLVVTTLCAAVAGVAGYWCAQTGLITCRSGLSSGCRPNGILHFWSIHVPTSPVTPWAPWVGSA